MRCMSVTLRCCIRLFCYRSLQVCIRFLASVVLLLPGLSQAQSGATPAIFYVTPTGTTAPASATASWATSTTDLQGAINAASLTGNAQVWVMAGTYKPGGNTNRNQTISFSLRNGVAVLGGFPATGSPTLAQRNPRTNATILSGDLDNDGTLAGNTYHLFNLGFGLYLNLSALLDGFELTGGNANNGYDSGDDFASAGGAVLNSEGNSPAFQNCVFRGNRAGLCDQYGCSGSGGAIYNYGGNPLFVNCTFIDNRTVQDGQGGAITNAAGLPSFINCSFIGNSAGTGGVYYSTSAPGFPRFTNCSFGGNSATYGAVGADYAQDIELGGPGAVLTNCVFWNNGAGGAFSNLDNTPPTLRFSLLEAPWMGNAVYEPTNRVAQSTPFSSTSSTDLNACAPAIGTASVQSYTATQLGPQIDELGNPRFRNTNSLDMGARQFVGTPNPQVTLISQPPASTVATVTTTVTAIFSVSSTAPISYGWYNGSTALSGQTSATLTLPTVQFSEAGQYRAVATTAGGCSLSSTAFQLTVVPINSLTVNITANPSLTVTQGVTVTFTASGAISYTWSTGFVGNPLILPVNATTPFSVSGLSGNNGGIASATITTVPVACRSVIYVTETGRGIQDGSNWANAIAGRNLQLAINAAQACSGQVWVASGTYKPTTDANRAVSFTMKPGVAVYGGFVGSETALSGRPMFNPNAGQPASSTLSGEIGDPNSTIDNSYHVIYNNPGLTNAAILDGFVVTGGRADVFGGGMFNNGAGGGNVCSPTVRNCSFIDNAAIYGGGVWNQGSTGGTSSPRFENTYFERNVATALGGAIYNQPDPNGTTSATLINCGFVNNSAPDGGAIYNNGYGGGKAAPLLLNCAFLNNTATRGAAMFNIGFTNGQAMPSVVNGSFSGNTASGGGGAIFNNPVSGTAATMLTNCVFWNNGGATALTPASNFTANTSLLEATLPNGSGNLLAGTTPFASTSSVALNPCAPAINMGDVATYNAFNGPNLDLIGNARLRSSLLDMGAQQFVGTSSVLVTITSQPPASLTLNAGDDLSIPVSATSSAALDYQWFRNGTTLAGQTSATLSIPAAQTADSGTYIVSVSAAGGCITTSTALQLTVAPSDRPVLTLTILPSATVTTGAAVTLTVSGAVSYTWADGTQGNRLILYPTSTTAISVTGTNALGFTGSRTQTITVVPIPCQSVIYVTQNGAGAQTGANWANAVRNLQGAIDATQPCGGQVWVARGIYKPTTDANRAISFNMRPGVVIYGGFLGSETTLSGRPALNPIVGQISSSTLSGEIGDPNSTTDNSFHVIYNSNTVTNSAILDGFVVSGGYATDAGGGMYNNANQIRLSNARWVCSPTIRNVLFTNNFAPFGGAIYNDSRVQGATTPILENTVFVSNTATLGGAIMNHTYNYGNANWRAVNCRFERNLALQGGAIYSNGDAGGEANFLVVNGVFVGNSATTGGVAYNYSRLIGVVSPSFVNCSFQGNSSVNYNDQSVLNGFVPGTTLPIFNNSVFWSNGGAGSFTASGQAPFLYNCALEPGTNYFNGTGNVFEASNPFSSTTTLQLNPCALAVNLADPNGYTLVGGPITDAVGNARTFGAGLDAGAFELQQAVGVRAVIVSQPVAATVVRVPAPIRLPMSATITVGTGNPMTYQWYKNGTALSGQTSATLSIPSSQTTDAGSYSVVLTSADGCSTTSTGSQVTVIGEFDVFLTALPSTTVTFGAPVTLVASGTDSYTWNTGATTDRIVDFPTVTTTYSVTGRSTSGVVSASSITITVTPLPCNPILYVTETGAGTRDGSSWTNAVAGQNLQAALFAKYNCGGGQVWVARGTYKTTKTTDRSIYFQALNTVTLLGGFVGNETAQSQRPAMNPRTGSPSSSTLSGEIGDPNSTTDNSFHVLFHPIGTNSSATLDGFVITGGYAPDYGGGMLNMATYASYQPTMNPAISNCLFVNNYAPLGGAVANVDKASFANVVPQFSNCVFRQNTALNGGAVANLSTDVIPGGEGVKAVFTDCVFSQNTALTDGGAVYNTNQIGNTAAGNAEPRFVNCVFRDNQAVGMGGAIRVFASLPSNVARSVAGGQWINCGFVGNRAQYGGVLGSSQNGGSTLLSFINSSFQSNTATVAGGTLWAGEFNVGTANLYVINSAFWGNGAGSLGAQSGDNGKIQVTNSLLEPGGGNYTATNSLMATRSPFVNATSVEPSPCSEGLRIADITSYTNVIVAGPATDLAGTPRFVSNLVDMGAVQFQTTPLLPIGITQQPLASTSVCTGSTLTIPVSVSGTGVFTYQWFKDGGSLGMAQSTSALSFSAVQPSDAGMYSVVVISACNSTTSAAFSLTVNALPTPTLLTSGTLTCAVRSVTLTANGGITYQFSAGAMPVGAGNQATVSQIGAYAVTATGANGCTATAITTVTSNTAPPPATLAVSSTILPCTNPSVTLTAGGGSAYWFSTGATSSSVVVSSAGIYSVTVTAANGCTASASAVVTVAPSVTATITGSLTFTQGNSTTLTASGGSTVSWSNGASTAAIVVTTGGVYSVTVSQAGSCPASTSVVVTEQVPVFAIATGSFSGTFCSGSVLSVAVSITGSAVSGNVFTVQLSNAMGSFAAPVVIGSLTATTASVLSVTLPVGSSTQSGFRIRVVTSNPAVVGNDNGSGLTLVGNSDSRTVQNGNWTDASTWLCGRIPTVGSVVIVGHAVTVPASVVAQTRSLRFMAGGRLVYGAGSTLRLGQ
jgi:predicted outer membrane repeat protein